MPSAIAWLRPIPTPTLARSFRVIRFDQRGIGAVVGARRPGEKGLAGAIEHHGEAGRGDPVRILDEVSGRGELQMGVLIENMRREGFELSISRPRVLFRDIDGVKHEPIEEVTIDVDDDYTGPVIEKITGPRKGDLVEMKPAGAGKTRIIAHVPSRGLIGYHGQFMTDTRGTGVLNRVFHGWAPHKGPIEGRRQGVLISIETGISVAYAMWKLEDRGHFFIGVQEPVYAGMIIGEHNRDNDLEVNPLKGKQLTNVRASGTDEAVRLTTPVKLSLEQCISYIDDDELVEVTPKSVRMRKRFLDANDRKRQSRAG
mgnify:CR=1 FL=1